MDVSIKSLGTQKITTVTLTGSLDVSGAAEIEMEMRSIVNRGTDIAVDLSNVTFISSQGARILVLASKAVVAKNNMLSLIGPKPQVRKVLGIMGLDKVIPIYNTLDDLEASK